MTVVTELYSEKLQKLSEKLTIILKRIAEFSMSQIETTAGIVISADPIDINAVPKINIIANFVNEQLVLRLEVIGNITQYIVHDFVDRLQQFRPIYIEVTDPNSGLIKYKNQLSRQLDLENISLYEEYKKEIFKFHYPREDGRLLVLLDQGQSWLQPLSSQYKKENFNDKTPNTYVERKSSHLTESTKKTEIESVPINEKIKSSIEPTSNENDLLLEEHDFKEYEHISKTASTKRTSLTQREQTVLKLVENKANKKVQSKGLRKSLNMDQDTIRTILRNLVSKDYLYVRAAWYIVKEEPNEDISDFKSEIPLNERLKRLTAKERKLFDLLAKRQGRKAQARMLMKESKMTKDNLKKLLRNMVAKDVLFVYAAWYIIKE